MEPIEENKLAQPEQQANVPLPAVPTPNAHYKILTILLIIVLSYMVGFKSGKSGYTFEPKEFKIVNQEEQPKDVNYGLLWEAIAVLNEKYIDKPVDQQKILYGAIKGAVESTGDPYTAFFEPKDNEAFKTDLKGSFDGIGAEIGKRNEQIVIIAPLDGTPAKKAGVLAGDIIAEVDHESTQGWTVEQTVSKIRGKKGTEVMLTLARKDRETPLEVKIIRDTIEVKSVKWEIKDVNGKQVAILTVSKFGDDTQKLFNQAVTDILNSGTKNLVLDLRNNPGGYLNTSVDLGSAWVSLGSVIVKEEKSTGESYEYKSEGNTRLSGIKTVVLINGGSASASEILAGALKDYGVATLIGEKSFGKGSVQELVELKDGSAVKVTIAKWITPKGRNLNKDGLVPDVEIKLTEEDINAGRDPQMDEAIEEVLK
jgi:carboxyl-terminal processing protease